MANLRPFKPIKPGDLLQEELDVRGWSQADLAAILQRPVQAINEIITGKKSITVETALGLATALGTSPEYWMNLESAYRLDLATQGAQEGREDPVARRARLYHFAPVAEMLKRNWVNVKNNKDLDEVEKGLCNFYQVDSLSMVHQPLCAARKTQQDEELTSAQRAWVHMVKVQSEGRPFKPYSQKGLKKTAKLLVHQSVNEEQIREIPKILDELGVSLIFVEAFPRTKIDGIAFWHNDVPIIGLSLRLKRIDYFFFTLLHEIAHILNEDAKEAKLDLNILDVDEETDREKRANYDARESLIPSDKLDLFLAKNPRLSKIAILSFAQKLNIHPAVLVGRLHFEGVLPYTHHRQMLGDVKQIFDDLIIR